MAPLIEGMGISLTPVAGRGRMRTCARRPSCAAGTTAGLKSTGRVAPLGIGRGGGGVTGVVVVCGSVVGGSVAGSAYATLFRSVVSGAAVVSGLAGATPVIAWSAAKMGAGI